ncbi:unnamed protein product [Orchesella dallaii]|uniref:Uncharacterized protein n=1 Tax=Orchesella dallaii TaxID=48710 RepID=A0ABP1RZG2_9HEXA
MSSNLESMKRDRNENDKAKYKKWRQWEQQRKEYGRWVTFWNFIVYSIFPAVFLLGYGYICKENHKIIEEFGMEWAFLCFLACCILDIVACIVGIISVWTGLNEGILRFANGLLLVDTLLNIAVAFALPAENGDGSHAEFLSQTKYPSHCYNRDALMNPPSNCHDLQRLAGFIWLTLILLVLRTFCIIHGSYTASVARYGTFYPVNEPEWDYDGPIVILPSVATHPYKVVVNHPIYRPGVNSMTHVRLTQSQKLQMDFGYEEGGRKPDVNANTPGEQNDMARKAVSMKKAGEVVNRSTGECTSHENDLGRNHDNRHNPKLRFNKKRHQKQEK